VDERQMTTAKNKMQRSYPPAYIDVGTLAYLLCCSESTIEKWEKMGRLPRRRNVFGLLRWKWAEIEHLIDGRDAADAKESDPFLDRLHA
jgi:hypothetical protein